jgi:ribonuclease M5
MHIIKEIIVVEGKSDTIAIRRAVQADTIETGGSAINKEILSRIKLAQSRRGVIIFTDPDHAGERLRHIISQQVQGCKHAFIIREKASHQGKIGIEHASDHDIIEALQHIQTQYIRRETNITLQDLIDAQLLLHPLAASRRMLVGKWLGIGYGNGKQFLKRCEMFHISREEFGHAIQQLNKKDTIDE